MRQLRRLQTGLLSGLLKAAEDWIHDVLLHSNSDTRNGRRYHATTNRRDRSKNYESWEVQATNKPMQPFGSDKRLPVHRRHEPSADDSQTAAH